MPRPVKYTAAELEEKVIEYFRKISRTQRAMEQYDTGEKDQYGHPIMGWREIYNDDGEIITYTDYVVAPNITDLCIEHLGISLDTWERYAQKKQYKHVTDFAEGKIRAYLHRQLDTRKDVRGIMFDLQVNHKMTPKQEIELGDKAAEAIKTKPMPIEEREALLRQTMEQIGGGDNAAEE